MTLTTREIPEETILRIAGMLSTVDFTPSERHPTEMIPIAVEVITSLYNQTEDELRALTPSQMTMVHHALCEAGPDYG